MPGTIAILGAGAWGTALAVHLATRSGAHPRVILWARRREHAAEMNRARENVRYLPEVRLPGSVEVTADPHVAARAELLFAAPPIASLVALADEMREIGAEAPLVWLSKGFVASGDLPAGFGLAHQILAKRWGRPVGVVSGPSFADEVARGLPTALTVAATKRSLARDVAQLLRGETLRAYETDDLPGVEVGGAIKNVLAIAAGASDGLGFGDNARAALITRGLAETGRLLEALGGRRESLMGLSGLGDLVLTCTGDLSRNRRVGLALSRGENLGSTLAKLGHVAEGVAAAKAAHALAAHHELDMPITDAVFRVLYENVSPRAAVEALLAREPKPEME
jgi:glycerol-3-phosphate dehydrogenase (NAD(P)+)